MESQRRVLHRFLVVSYVFLTTEDNEMIDLEVGFFLFGRNLVLLHGKGQLGGRPARGHPARPEWNARGGAGDLSIDVATPLSLLTVLTYMRPKGVIKQASVQRPVVLVQIAHSTSLVGNALFRDLRGVTTRKEGEFGVRKTRSYDFQQSETLPSVKLKRSVEWLASLQISVTCKMGKPVVRVISSMTELDVADFEIRTPGRDTSGWATRSNEGWSSACALGLRDSMRAEVMVYTKGCRDRRNTAWKAWTYGRKGLDPSRGGEDNRKLRWGTTRFGTAPVRLTLEAFNDRLANELV
ncbi:hypothetical protein EDB85DRAFT_1892082 [Lactarius pseudohatsudake]|nr:hypothetical protein EDB85DRAFT_1892082 [Lactarius pseudohatsudake]